MLPTKLGNLILERELENFAKNCKTLDMINCCTPNNLYSNVICTRAPIFSLIEEE